MPDAKAIRIIGMKQALDCYEQLTDAFDYATSSWLRMEIQKRTREEALNILGAASYLFDSLFAEENAGSDITRAVYDDLLENYDAKALAQKATSLRLNMDKGTYEKGGTPFRDYYNWILPSEPDLVHALSDQAGLLSFATIDAIVTLLSEQNKECAPLRIAEIVFLNFTRAFERIFKAHYGVNFTELQSRYYFNSVEEEFERIRASIGD